MSGLRDLIIATYRSDARRVIELERQVVGDRRWLTNFLALLPFAVSTRRPRPKVPPRLAVHPAERLLFERFPHRTLPPRVAP